MPSSDLRNIKAKGILLLALILMLICLILAWQWSSLNEWLDANRLVAALREIGAHQGLIISIVYIALASVIAVPLGIIIVVSAITFGPWLGGLFVLIGACLGGSISYSLGSLLGHDALCKFAGKRANNLSVRLEQRGFLSVFILRLLPIAPFAIVNMIAGTTHIRWLDFLLGTFFGMIPGIVIITALSDWVIGNVVS